MEVLAFLGSVLGDLLYGITEGLIIIKDSRNNK